MHRTSNDEQSTRIEKKRTACLGILIGKFPFSVRVENLHSKLFPLFFFCIFIVVTILLSLFSVHFVKTRGKRGIEECFSTAYFLFALGTLFLFCAS